MEGPELRSGAPRVGLWGHGHTPTGRHSHTHTGTPVMHTPQRPRSEAATVTSGQSAARAAGHRLDGTVGAATRNHRVGDASQPHRLALSREGPAAEGVLLPAAPLQPCHPLKLELPHRAQSLGYRRATAALG